MEFTYNTQLSITVYAESEEAARKIAEETAQRIAEDATRLLETQQVELATNNVTIGHNRLTYPITDEDSDPVGTMVIEAGHDGVWVSAYTTDGLGLGGVKLDWFNGQLKTLVHFDPDGDNSEIDTTILVENTRDPETLDEIRKSREEDE